MLIAGVKRFHIFILCIHYIQASNLWLSLRYMLRTDQPIRDGDHRIF